MPPAHTHPLKNQSSIFETLWVIIFWVRVTYKMLNVNWGKNSLNNIICHLSWLKKLFPCSYTHPLKTIREFSKPYELLFSELESLIKCNHKIRVQECYGGRAMSCSWHGGGGVEAYGGALLVDMQPLRLFHFNYFGL